jgi:hypothetical protein
MSSLDKEFTNSFQWILFFSILIFIAEYPDRPKCIKYICVKYPYLKWIFIFLWLYGRKHNYILFICIFITYHIFYLLDDYLYDNYSDFKNFKDSL